MKHTPGPWFIKSRDLEIYSNNLRICKYDPLCESESTANANLIAAAPDMLKALEGAVIYLRCYMSDESLKTHLAAIAKAKGVSS